jgi:ectoine hydroxylase-related dioxygenase (phytanoyl-CoA dioxygenase family)
MAAAIPRFSASESQLEMGKALGEAGCLVITGLADATTLAALERDLAPHFEQAPVKTSDDTADFYPGHTRRVTALVARSEAAGELILNPTVRTLCDGALGESANAYRLHVTAGLMVGPGARAQILHREEDPFTFFPVPRPNLVLATMWAVSDFRADNGATLIVPGSHRWEADRVAQPDEVVSAEMPAGSILFWAGGTFHGAGENRSDEWRYGVIVSYSLAWLRQEENQYLDVPPHVAKKLSQEMRAMIGYDMHGSLGFFDPSVR